jgi:preprotein translocase subunit SecY
LVDVWTGVVARRLVVTGLCLVAWRCIEQITVPGVTPSEIAARLSAVDTSTPLHAIGTGGIALAPYSILVMGIGPYINALIVMTVVPVVSKRVRTLAISPAGQSQLRRWTRAIAVAFCLGQAYGWTILMQSEQAIDNQIDWFYRLVLVLELTCGTLTLVLLADVIDEHGVGFGNGAILIYALTLVAIEVHRLAEIFAVAPAVDALYRPFGIWVLFSVGVIAASVAVLLAVRRINPPPVKKGKPGTPVDLKLLMSGVLRPPAFAGAVSFVPVVVANYLAASHPDATHWVTINWSAYGPNPWMDAAYVAFSACLVIGFAYFVVACDLAGAQIPRHLASHITRLTFIGGTCLALGVSVAPVLEHIASRKAGTAFTMSGTDAVLVVAVIIAIIRTLEKPAKSPARSAVPAPALP